MSYKLGDWNIICDVCGKKVKASTTKRRWDGFIVCPEDYEQRHPLDFIRVRADRQSVPFSRPESEENEVVVYNTNTATDHTWNGSVLNFIGTN